jgi:hypothetical protein
MSREGRGMSNAVKLSRRALVAGAAMLALCGTARADSGFVVDWQGGEQTPEVAASLAAQIALVERLKVSDAAMAYFRAQVITVDRAMGTHTRAGPRGIFFERRAVPPDNPVLLHEIIHRWQLERMPGGKQNPDVLRFYQHARASGLYPPDAYMLSNPFEFFAMTASAVLHGRTARPPFERENVRRKSPELYRFIVREFGFRG